MEVRKEVPKLLSQYNTSPLSDDSKSTDSKTCCGFPRLAGASAIAAPVGLENGVIK
jgi:hypothetical protein